VRHEVVNPADSAAIAWLCQLLRSGRADLYVEDEADLSLLPTLTRTWMRVGEQLQVRAPGTNEKRSVAAATDLGDGGLLWRTDERRCAVQFGLLLQQCVARSTARRRLAVLLVDNAQSHRVGKKGLIRLFLRANAGRVVLVFLPAYSPDLQPAERLWRQWRPNVTHNHTCSAMEQLVGNSDAWLTRAAAEPQSVLQMLGERARIGSKLMAA
jgi:DDE superfamily endonuclease